MLFNMNPKAILFLFCFLFVIQGYAQKTDWRNLDKIEFTGSDLISPLSVVYRLDEFERQIQNDLDGDGVEESLLFISGFKGEKEAWGIEFCKDGYLLDQFLFDLEEISSNSNLYDVTFQLSLHDFDNDNVPEIIITYGDDPDFAMSGKIFKICGRGVKLKDTHASELKGWLREVGNFGTHKGYWRAEGNLLYTSSLTGGYDDIVMVYVDSELRYISK